MTIIGRGRKRERKKVTALEEVVKSLRAKNVIRGVAVLRQGNLAQNGVEQWNIYLFIQQILIIFSVLLLIFVFIVISSHSCD